MTTLAVPADPAAPKSFKEVWLITIGHSLTPVGDRPGEEKARFAGQPAE
jgi:hypothetical protein